MSDNVQSLIPQYSDEFIRIYRDGLLKDIVPFWIEHSIDREHGGFLTSLDRDGTVIDTDKSVWLQGRFVWMLSALHNTVRRYGVESKPEWLEVAKHGVDFLDAHGFDEDGRMFFLLTRDGRPLRKRRYIFSECFTIIAYAAYAQATENADRLQRAVDLFQLTQHYLATPGLLPPKTDPQTRPMKGIAVPMIMISTAQVLREAGGDPELCNYTIDRYIDEIARDFMHPELRAVLEAVGPDGEFLDCYDGRTVTPGHAIEAAWFILDEAAHRGNDARLTQMGVTMLEWMWELGWDEEYGGLYYFRDVKGLPVQEYWHDMKFWWPHNEAIIATLLAYQLTGDGTFAQWHTLAHEWAFRHFPDAEYGEWFGYLHRDGSLSVPLKGNQWKGAFHVPRMYWKCWQILEEMKSGR